MTAALITIMFLASAWIAIVALAGTVEGRLGRIGAALRRHQPAARLAMTVPVRARYSPRRQRAVARSQLRAAA